MTRFDALLLKRVGPCDACGAFDAGDFAVHHASPERVVRVQELIVQLIGVFGRLDAGFERLPVEFVGPLGSKRPDLVGVPGVDLESASTRPKSEPLRGT